MRIPRDVSGEELIRLLGRIGYRATRQTGSHVRLTLVSDGEHQVTIPKSGDLRVGTLNSILKDVADHLKVSKEELIERLWER